MENLNLYIKSHFSDSIDVKDKILNDDNIIN
ncbi:phosphoheptose isomerase, partial [Campylobacter coli]|nr:phosphoheptose isomerase [Campylobacter coli]